MATASVQSEDSSQLPSYQQTIGESVTATGVGLHLGQQTTVRLLPAEPNEGRYFVRTDLDAMSGTAFPRIAATVDRVVQTQLSTELGVGEGPDAPTVRTVEHLLSALVALEIDNVRIEISGPELPLLDGSAKEWMAAIAPAGTTAQSAPRACRTAPTEPISVCSGDALVTAFPSSELRFSYGIDFELAAIGNQWHSWSPAQDDFSAEIAPARTFGLAHQIDYLREQGLIKGGSLENALVCGNDGWINPPLRFDNEPARHKLLDLVGDLSLLGDIPKAHYVAYKASHGLHVALAKKLLAVCTVSSGSISSGSISSGSISSGSISSGSISSGSI
ncbi:MAG: UDP-3-O-acyl-N-acetylglucosamine deacetylase, partial [Cyanobacteria bacterium J06598_3]